MRRTVLALAGLVAMILMTGCIPSVSGLGGPAWNDAGPDPDIVRVGSTWYAYTTGTSWGNNIGVLTSSSPQSGWHTVTGKSYGSTALPKPPSWETPGTQWAPGVYQWGGRFMMFYAAQVRATGGWCISVATSTNPAGPFIDASPGPTICQPELGGSIDPQPFVDKDGRPWLHWKNNDGGSAEVSRVWAVPLADDGGTPAGPYTEVLAKDTQHHPWMTTVDNPQMVNVDGNYVLFFSAGAWDGPSYTVGWAGCVSPTGPCIVNDHPILGAYGGVVGTGGGTAAQDAAGKWWLSYHAWDASCTNDACGGKRKLYVAPLTFR